MRFAFEVVKDGWAGCVTAFTPDVVCKLCDSDDIAHSIPKTHIGERFNGLPLAQRLGRPPR